MARPCTAKLSQTQSAHADESPARGTAAQRRGSPSRSGARRREPHGGPATPRPRGGRAFVGLFSEHDYEKSRRGRGSRAGPAGPAGQGPTRVKFLITAAGGRPSPAGGGLAVPCSQALRAAQRARAGAWSGQGVAPTGAVVMGQGLLGPAWAAAEGARAGWRAALYHTQDNKASQLMKGRIFTPPPQPNTQKRKKYKKKEKQIRNLQGFFFNPDGLRSTWTRDGRQPCSAHFDPYTVPVCPAN